MASAHRGTAISHARALVDWAQHSIPKLLKLEKVMPGLVQRKVVSKKLGKGIVKNNDISTLLGILQVKPIQVFVNFLQALADTFPECETHKELVIMMRDSLERIDLPADSEACRAAIQEVIARATLKEQSETPVQPGVQTPIEEVLPTAGESDLTNVADSGPESEVAANNDKELTEESSPRRQTINYQTHTTHSDSRTADTTIVPQPASLDPTSGYIKPCRFWLFTKEGGVFHCSAHGIIGHIPTTAVPPEIDSFEVGMKVFMHGDFRFPADIEPCTAVVEFSLTPSFDFIEDITIKIPHCAGIDGEVDSETFCLLKTTKRHAPGVDHEVLEARYSDHYHVIANLRHFCKLVGGCRIPLLRQRRWSRSGSTGITKKDSPRSTRDCVKKIRHVSTLRDLARQGSVSSQQSSPSLTGSFESSWEDQGTSPSPIPQTVAQSLATPCHLVRQEAFDVGRNTLLAGQQSSSEDAIFGSCNLYIVQCMPRQCAGGWETNFFLSCALPTAMLIILQAVENACTKVETKHFCRPTESHLAFNPQHWNEDGWEVYASGTPRIAMQDVTQYYHFSKELTESLVSAGLYPSRISYLVNHTNVSSPAPLKCKIDVKGAEINGEPVYFMLTSPPRMLKCFTRRLHTLEYLYHPESPICSAVCGSSIGADLLLDPQSEDHRRFIADISFQLTETDLQHLAAHGILGFEKPQLDAIMDNHSSDIREQIYQILLSWISRNSTVESLLSILNTLGISRIEVRKWSAESIEKRSVLSYQTVLFSVVITFYWLLPKKFTSTGDSLVDLSECPKLTSVLHMKTVLLKLNLSYPIRYFGGGNVTRAEKPLMEHYLQLSAEYLNMIHPLFAVPGVWPQSGPTRPFGHNHFCIFFFSEMTVQYI